MYITIHEIDEQSMFNAWNRALKAGALGQPRGMGWGGRRKGGSGWGIYTKIQCDFISSFLTKYIYKLPCFQVKSHWRFWMDMNLGGIVQPTMLPSSVKWKKPLDTYLTRCCNKWDNTHKKLFPVMSSIKETPNQHDLLIDSFRLTSINNSLSHLG